MTEDVSKAQYILDEIFDKMIMFGETLDVKVRIIFKYFILENIKLEKRITELEKRTYD